MDHAWLMMRSHAQGMTRMHSWKMGAVMLGGDNTARSRTNAGSKGSRGKGLGRRARPRGRARLSAVSPPSSPLPKHQLLQHHTRPQWQHWALVAEGEVLQLRGKLQDV